jgi:hypothetical protein
MKLRYGSIAHNIHWIGDWVGHTSRLGAVKLRKLLATWGIQPGSSSSLPIAVATELGLPLKKVHTFHQSSARNHDMSVAPYLITLLLGRIDWS